MTEETEEKKTSLFNQGVSQMIRIHMHLDRINLCNINLKAFNDNFQCYNFEVVLKSLNALRQEVDSKLDPTSKKESLETKDMCEKYLRNKPVFGVARNLQKKALKFNRVHFMVLSDILYLYETRVRTYLEKTGMNAPISEDEGMF